MANPFSREEEEFWLSRVTTQVKQKLSGFKSQEEELSWLNRTGPEPKKKIQIDFKDPFAPMESGPKPKIC
jgi:hypothetical protein